MCINDQCTVKTLPPCQTLSLLSTYATIKLKTKISYKYILLVLIIPHLKPTDNQIKYKKIPLQLHTVTPLTGNIPMFTNTF